MNFKDLLMSSTDRTKVSLAIKGISVAVIPVLIVLTGSNEADLNALVEVIIDVVYFGGAFISAAMTVSGIVRKVQLRRWVAPENDAG